MKQSALILFLAASIVAANAQAPAKPAAPAAKPATTAAAPATTTAAKLPLGVPAPGIPPVKTLKKTAFSLQYQEIKVGDGPVAEPNKLYKVHYTGWLGANGRPDDGRKFDSSYDRPGPPMKDKENKPVIGDDGKPKLEPPQPMPFPQGFGRVIPGFDQGFEGMKIGGKRRIFIPWQLAYGAKGRPGPDAAHPGIPEKANLIFDVELVEVNDLPMPANHPPMGGMRPMPGGRPMPGAPGTPAQPGTPSAPGTAPTPPAPPTPAAAPASSAAPAPAAVPKPSAPSAAATAPSPTATPATSTPSQPK
jgi:peptidylprolyl isomerase